MLTLARKDPKCWVALASSFSALSIGISIGELRVNLRVVQIITKEFEERKNSDGLE